MEFTSDTQGNKYFSFEEDNSPVDEINQLGNKLDDYEILQILSESEDPKDTSYVAKVRSLNNNKIYSMKKINLFGAQINNAKILLEKLIEINHPHIIKYYTSFVENNDIYLIMEYMDNSDILGYIQAFQIFNKCIPESEIWNILLQCLSALNYLNSMNYGKYGIKLTNIFINNMYNIKIGVFRDLNFSAQAYDLKNDINLLKKYFYILMNSQFHKIEELDNKSFIDNLSLNIIVNNNYSNELVGIINSMPSTTLVELYEKTKKEYAKKYTKYTSINSILRCLSSYKYLTDTLEKQRQLIETGKEKYYMNNWYLKIIDAFAGKNEDNLQKFFEEFRREMACTYSKLDGNKEIDPLLVLIFILNKMHKEMNDVDKSKINEAGFKKFNINTNNSMKNYVFNGEEIDRTNKIQILQEFINYFNSNFISPISNLFVGFMKTKKICANCLSGYYSFSNFLYVTFDLSKRKSEENFDLINDGFKKNFETPKVIEPNSRDKIWCERCQTYQKFSVFDRYYMINSQLIICFIRGPNYKNCSKILFQEQMNIKDFVEPGIIAPHNFYLVGCVNRKIENGNEEYVSYYKNNENKWNPKQIENNGKEQTILLFYNSNDINH